uniref:ARAD1B06424p n=1 Tax=Blastobotrys adeninivorans TaxID=409370 RepID=A0A060T4W7_BLAAD
MSQRESMRRVRLKVFFFFFFFFLYFKNENFKFQGYYCIRMSRKFEAKRKAPAKESKANPSKKLKAKEVAPREESEESEDELDVPSSDEDELDQSEDELDGSNSDSNDDSDDSDDSEDSDDSDNEGDEEEEADEGQDENMGNGMSEEDKRKQREEKKKLKEERKMSRPNGAKIQDIKKIWEKLRVKAGVTPAERKKLVNEIWDQVHDCVKELVLKHDASRVVQTIFKYADKEKRIAITKALKGSYVDLAKSAYGKYLLVKLLHYGSAQVREDVHNELHGNFRKLMKHKEGAYVIEDAYRDYSTAAQKRQMIREFYGSEFAVFKDHKKDLTLADIIAENPDKRPFVMRNLYETIAASVNKGSIGFTVIHAAMLEYVKNIDATTSEREDFIQLIVEQFAEMVHTNEGSQVACRILAMATAKERRQLVKSLRPFVSKMAEDEYGQFVLITLFNTVDDTVMVSKGFTPDFKENIESLIVSKNGRRPFVYLLCGPTSRYFTKDVMDKFAVVDELKKNTSKKEDDVRRLELNKAFSPLILNAIENKAPELLKNNLGAQFIAEALLYAHEVDRTNAIEAVCKAMEGSPKDQEDHLIHDAVVSRTLRALIQQGHWNMKSKQVDKAPEADSTFAKVLYSHIEDYVAEWAQGDGAFVIVALLETLESSEAKKLKKTLKGHQKAIQQSEAKGVKLILEKI